METYLDQPIKDVITGNPQVGALLAEYDVGCVTCQVGTCLLKDVVAIHGLSSMRVATRTTAPEFPLCLCVSVVKVLSD